MLAVSNYEQFTGYGGQFFTELRVDGSTVTRGFTQCVGVGGSSCALDDRMAALSIAEPVTNGDTDTFTLVGRVAGSSTTGYICLCRTQSDSVGERYEEGLLLHNTCSCCCGYSRDSSRSQCLP
ncbi:MAG: hypothetical protein RMJ59_07120 [Candidatus Nitrosocaldus sp.]|nr:hypothetical protein [Candidatus Nitrosocaldus sp.]